MRAHDPSHARGIDVSSWQGDIDWPAVRTAGFSFAVIKATEGVGWTDPKYAKNVAGAKSAGLLVGAYHFARPDGNALDAANEAAYFAGAVKAVQPEPDFLALDLEATKLDRAGTTAWALAFLRALAATFPGKRVLLYTGPSFAAQNLDGAQLSSWPLWVAHYTNASSPMAVPGFGDWTIWQWTSSGKIPGTSGYVDLDEFAGTEQDLRAWLGGADLPKGGDAAVASPGMGQRGPAVQALQHLLNAAFGEKLAEDGIWGPLTEAAYQRALASDLAQQVRTLQSKISAARQALA
ncbi:MAG: glycoside hydrolase family 25 protein [Bacillota bacterium]|nr:glycoside hydrolase family 25 protein [Bacillota bacterium]